MMARRLFRRFRADRRGATIVEFAFVAPVALLMILGSIELGHTAYVTAILQGEMQKAARDLSLESASSATRQAAIEDRVRTRVRQVMPVATVAFEVSAFNNYENARDDLEPLVSDANGNDTCDAGDTYRDLNHSGTRDDGSTDGRGGAKDVVLMTANVSYDRLPLGRMFTADDTTELKASMILRNQPSEKQREPVTVTC